jgi:protoporphyrinogen oxidase
MSTISGHIGIVGGGVLGMFLALKLRQAGARVTILESASRTGGLACSDDVGGFTWDRFYHVILLSDAYTRGLLEELGIADKLRWGITRTGFYTDGKLYSLSNNLEFLRFPPLSLIDKVRLGGTIFLASRIRDGRTLEQVLCESWLARWSGRRVVDRIWLPLLKSKLGENYRIASASFIWAIIARMYAARRSGLKREMFGYVDGGYELILSRLQQRLDSLGVTTRYNAKVASVEDRGSLVDVKLGGGETLTFDKVVATVPTGAIASLCPQLREDEKARLRKVEYQGIVCASLLTKQPLGPFYVTNITDRWVPFTGVIEMTALVDRERFGGNSLVYLPCYLTQQDAYWNKTDAEIESEFLGALERMYPHFKRSDVVSFKVSRARQVLAISTLGYSDQLLPPLTTSLPNVFVLNSAQIANGTLNVNETIGVVHAHLPALVGHLREPRAVTPAAA